MTDGRPMGRHYRWVIVALAALSHFAGLAAIGVHSFSLMVLPLQKEFGWTRSSVTLANSIMSIALIFVAPLFGYLADRWSAKWLMCFSAFALGVILLGLSRMTALWQFYVLFLGIALFGAGTIAPIYTRLISSWFDRRLGLALGLVMAGGSAAAAVDPVLVGWLIRDGDWRNAYLALGLLNLVVIGPLLAIFIRHGPNDGGGVGHQGNGAKPDASPSHRSAPDFSFGEAVRRRSFWFLLLAFVTLSFGQAVYLNLVPLLIWTGMIPGRATGAASLMGAAMLISRIVTGALLDRFSARWVAAVIIASSAVGMLLLSNAASTPVLLVGVVLLGFVYGGEIDLMGYLVITYFGRRVQGRIQSVIYSAFLVGGASGGWFTSSLYDKYATYSYSLLVGAATAMIAIALIAMLGRASPPEDRRPVASGHDKSIA